MSVAIIGCGWLGSALATHLLKASVNVIGTCQSDVSLQKLQDLGIRGIKLVLPFDNEPDEAVFDQLSADTWVISITPQLRKGRIDYPLKIEQLVTLAKQLKVKRIILVSSTAVLNGLTGDVNEHATLVLNAPKVDVLAQAEQLILATDSTMQTAVIRMSGLVGEDRHPGRFFKQTKQYTQGNAPVNLIHKVDAVGLLACLVSCNEVSGIYHGVSETNATKANFYQQSAKALGQPEPEFDIPDKEAGYKRIVGTESTNRLGYQFQIPDLLKWVTTSK